MLKTLDKDVSERMQEPRVRYGASPGELFIGSGAKDWGQFPSLQDEHGMVKWKFRLGPGLDPELFERVQDILHNNRKHNHRIYDNQRTYFLSGILYDIDGNKFYDQSVKSKENPYYINPAKNYGYALNALRKLLSIM